MKVGIYFDKTTFEKIEAFAKEKGLTRSSAVRYCVNSILKNGDGVTGQKLAPSVVSHQGSPV